MAKKPVKGNPPRRNPRDSEGKTQDWLDQSGALYEPNIGHEEPGFDPSRSIYRPGQIGVHPSAMDPRDRPVPRSVIKKGTEPWALKDLIESLVGQYGDTPRGSIRNSSPIVLPGDKRLPLANVPLAGGATGLANVPLSGGRGILSNVPTGGMPNTLITALPGRGITQVTNVPQRGAPKLSHADMLRILAAHHANTQGLAL